MKTQEIVQTLMNHIQTGDFVNARKLLANDFQFSGPIPTPIDADEWLKMSASLKTAFPDINYNFKITSVNGDRVNATSQLRGTHLGDFDLTSMDMGVIPATKKAFAVGLENAHIIVRDKQILSWAIEPNEAAGVMAIVKQLGVEVPTPA